MIMRLTKKYRIVYHGVSMLFPLEPFDSGITYVQKGMQSAEFDTLEEAEAFIYDNQLVYEPTIEN